MANQSLARQWWQEGRPAFSPFISQIVLIEIGAGDGEAAKARLDLVSQIPLLTVTSECEALAEHLLEKASLPRAAARDAIHIATAAVHRMDFLLTWNCRHIANAVLIPRLGSIIRNWGYACPLLCTPPQLLDWRTR